MVFLGRTTLRTIHFILEGGAIESDGNGTILTTRSCLANPNRYPGTPPKPTSEAALARFIGATRVCWLEHGYLAGDDTDGHIDMLARFAPHDTLVYTACDVPADAALPRPVGHGRGTRRLAHPGRSTVPPPAPALARAGVR